MRTLPLLAMLAFSGVVSAQEIYKWEDEKGVLHYGEKPDHPAATPLAKDAIPYSTTGGSSRDRLEREDARTHTEIREASPRELGRQPRPSPSLIRAKAVLGTNGRLRLSGVIRNGGKGLCESPTVEVVLFDDNGSIDGSFETAAFPAVIARGQEARFEGEFFTPVGERVSWDAVPRCDGADGAVYGGHKSGSLKLRQSRTLRLRTFKTQ